MGFTPIEISYGHQMLQYATGFCYFFKYLMTILTSTAFSHAMSEIVSVAQQLWVESNGDIGMYVYKSVSFLCPMNIRDFPFDKQVCSVEFSSFAYSSSELILNIDIPEYYSTTSVGIILYTSRRTPTNT
ncbi:unnamed protein product [Cylicostephanus goldi]|uniref:Neurotransmitter-gated ion-channel ligand-binding domain-containing protein n=1 Tax=Cylicostephanus goldi TaxID=71465 RepID=A0A3P6TL12_CYLGO|nr:unnamed protein product [Cylicostephanus goldi]